jgi:ElaB/YqjD/DUF883 family membrane-anchored ribosome-binding protein
MTDTQESGNGSMTGNTQIGERMNQMRENVQGLMNSRQVNEALDRLRSLIDQSSQVLRDLGQQSGQWTQAAQNRAGDMARQIRDQAQQLREQAKQIRDQAKQLRDQSGVAFDSVSHQIEENPLASVGIAFGAALAIGLLAGALLFRR